MCGISGFVSRTPRPCAPIHQMTSLVRHRGPDDEGYLLVTGVGAAPEVFGGADTPAEAYRSGSAFTPADTIDAVRETPVILALGHRRLSILDLSVLGHQPMCTADRRHWIVYNGEVYNYRELHEELARLGHDFRSRSDTEVILAAYAQWGADCLRHLNGMWAFAIYDAEAAELFVARDRFGIKPLYYWVTPDGTFCFASEIKQFMAVPGWNAILNRQRAYDFLAWGLTDHTDETMFAGVYQLRPGQYLRVPIARVAADADGRVTTQQWYDLQPAVFTGSFEDAAAECARLLTESVQLMLRADVPVGSCLSGGIDSSSIVCIMNHLLREQDAAALQKTFSACADVERFDERKWIEQVVRATGVDAHYVYPSVDGLVANSSAIMWHQDEPYGSTSIYAQWCVFRLAAEHGVKVMLDGQGADEAFAGYHSFFSPYFAALLRSGDVVKLWESLRANRQLHGYTEGRALLRTFMLLLPPRSRNRLRVMFGTTDASPSWLQIGALGASPRDPLETLGRDLDSVQTMSRAQLTASNLQMLLHWEDRDSMAHSVESRVPFLDHRLVEFALGLPDDFKLAGGMTKRVLRRGMSGILPDPIRDRIDKMAFVTPEESWMQEGGGGAFRARLQAAVDSSQGIVSGESLKVFDDMIGGQRPFSTTPWRLIAFGEWMSTFGVSRH